MGKVKAKKSASVAKKAKVARAAVSAPVAKKAPRKLKRPQYKTFKLQQRIKTIEATPSAFKITKMAATLLWQNKKLFAGIAVIYGALNILLVRGLTGSLDVASLKSQLDQVFNGQLGQLGSSLAVFAVLVGSSGSGVSSSASVYQAVLILVVSLAVIWSLRQRLAGAPVRMRDGFYRGMYPLVPFILVLIVVGLQLLPMVVGASLYSLVMSGGIAVYAIEKVFWLLLLILLSLLSLYMICSSLFALYIVTLPDMTPMKALRSARELVRHRRWPILRKLLFLPIILLLATALIVVPIIIFVAPAAQWVVFALSMVSIIVIHTYMYTLYRELL